MKTVTIYQTETGIEFRDKEMCLLYEKFYNALNAAMDKLEASPLYDENSTAADIIDFAASETQFIQQERETVLKFFNVLVSEVRKLLGFEFAPNLEGENLYEDFQKVFTYDWEGAYENGNEFLELVTVAYERLRKISKESWREYGSIYALGKNEQERINE